LNAIIEIISLDKITAKAETVGYPNYKLPFDVVAMVLHPLKGAKHVLNDEVCKKIALAGKDAFIKWIEQLDDKEIKDLNKDLLNSELELIKDFLTLGYSEQEARAIMQNHEMMISLKFLQSGSLEKRLNAIGDIKRMIEHVETKIGLSDEFLKNWLLEHNILGKVLDENTHSEIIKRSSVIFAFLAKKGAITTDTIEALWNCQQEKHEDIVLAIYNTIKNIVEFLSPEHIQFIYEKIKNLPLDHYDEKLITFMKDFTLSAFSSMTATSTNTEYSSEVPKPIYDANGALLVHKDSKLFFATTFWSLIQDESAATVQQTELMVRCLRELLAHLFCEDYRSQYLYLCVENLKRHNSVPQCLELAIHILDMASAKLNNSLTKTRDWAKELWNNHDLFNIFIEDCENYERLVRESCEKRGTEDNIDSVVIAGKYKHGDSLAKRFNFFECAMKAEGREMNLGQANIERLCNLYINSTCQYNRIQFLLNFSSRDDNRASTFIFNRKETKIFFDIISTARSKLISLGIPYYRCFANNFQLINMQGELKFTADGILVLNFPGLHGMDQLCDSILHCEEKTTLDLFINLLIAVYTRVDISLPQETKAEISQSFIDRCFSTIATLNIDHEELAITNLMKLLEAMFDFVDGKEFEVEDEPGQRFSLTLTLRPGNVCSLSLDNEIRNVEVNMDVKIGSIRKMAADLFQVPFSELKMQSKSKLYHQSDNYSSLRSIGWTNAFYFQRLNTGPGNPKTYLAHSQAHINALFVLLSKENTGYVDLVWKLLNNIPPNKEMQADIASINLADGVFYKCNGNSKHGIAC
jgi:hypothetical protein